MLKVVIEQLMLPYWKWLQCIQSF